MIWRTKCQQNRNLSIFLKKTSNAPVPKNFWNDFPKAIFSSHRLPPNIIPLLKADLFSTALTFINFLKNAVRNYGITDGESIAICGLLHDICKANFYTISYRNAKNERGQWEKVPYYTVDDQFPFGHGEKSVFVVERFMRLRENEAIAIRWHMGGFDEAAKSGGFSISHAYEKYPLAVLLHMADLEATYLSEQGPAESII